jgi:hypothetical protein
MHGAAEAVRLTLHTRRCAACAGEQGTRCSEHKIQVKLVLMTTDGFVH